MKRLFAGALLAATALAAPPITPLMANPTAAPAAAPIVVHIKDFKYAPTPLKIHVGDRVKFINDDDEAHTVTSQDKSFDSGGLDTNGTWVHTFTKPGTYSYFCELHPYMKATIVVSPATAAPTN
jgi:plastocyanin